MLHNGSGGPERVEHRKAHNTHVSFATECTMDNNQTVITEHHESHRINGSANGSAMTTTHESTTLVNHTDDDDDDDVTPDTPLTSPLDIKPGPPIIRLQRQPSQESHDNPFTQEGELSKKAEYILKHSTISRSEIRISDPDLSKGQEVVEEISKTEVSLNASAPNANEIRRENGKLEQALSPQSVEVEVGKANASQPEPQQAEQVKLKEPKCKCCVIM